MIINHNISTLNVHNQLNRMNLAQVKSMEKLSSGLRINKAGDDAAGLAISEKMRGQIRGLAQEQRNIQDGISLLQTAEGGLQEIHELLHRGHELSVQSKNDTLTDTDRESIQVEINQIVKEVDRIANDTEFNTINLLNVTSSTDSQEQQKAVEALQKYWLKNSEDLITNYYGLTADGASLDIQFVQNSGDGKVAWVQGSYYSTGTDGRYFNQKLVLDMSDFSPVTMPNGGGSWISNDRIIAHEMVHAVMGRTTNFRDLPKWFKEGTAEFLAGADERLNIDSNNGADFSTLKNEIDSWDNTSADYSAAYAAVKYLDAQLTAAGKGGIKGLLNEIMLTGGAKTLDQALTDLLGYNEAGFLTDFKTDATLANSNIDLSDTDTGAIGNRGNDYAAVPDTLNGGSLTDPLVGFTESWPTFKTKVSQLRLGPSIYVELSNVTSGALGIDTVNILDKTEDNISVFDGAIQYVSSERSKLGAFQNRLEQAMEVTANSEENLTSAESRIRDVDMAKEMMNQTKQSILSRAALAMLAQANQQPQSVLQLIS